MRQMHRTVAYLAGWVFLLSAMSYGQSLGDVAREQRQKQQAKKDQPAAKVITNEDLPEHSPDEDDADAAQRHEYAASPINAKSAERWKEQIAAQKRSIASLQSQMDKLNSSIHFVEANRYYHGVQHNERQEQKQEQVQRMQEQLDRQKQQLEEMQEAARKQGFGNSVYDP